MGGVVAHLPQPRPVITLRLCSPKVSQLREELHGVPDGDWCIVAKIIGKLIITLGIREGPKIKKVKFDTLVLKSGFVHDTNEGVQSTTSSNLCAPVVCIAAH